MREAARDLLVRFIPARHVMDDDDSGVRPGAERTREIGVDLVVLVSTQVNGFGQLCFVRHGPLL